jgi:hypothetical protein
VFRPFRLAACFLLQRHRRRRTSFSRFRVSFSSWGRTSNQGISARCSKTIARLAPELPSGQSSTTGANSSTSTLAKAYQALGQDLQAGNLPAAQQDLATIQQSAQQGAGEAHGHRCHPHGGSVSQQTSALQQDFGALGQALQAGNVSSAQQVYASLHSYLQSAFPELAATGNSTSSRANGTSSAINVAA